MLSHGVRPAAAAVVISAIVAAVRAYIPQRTPNARLLGTDVTLLVSSSVEEIREHLRVLMQSGPTYIGLDAEWRPVGMALGKKRHGRGSAKSGDTCAPKPAQQEASGGQGSTEQGGSERVAVLQLASEDVVLVIQLLQATRGGVHPVPRELKELLGAPHIVKLGVGIHDDASRLQDSFGLECRSYLDLRSLAMQQHRASLAQAENGYDTSPLPLGLKGLAAVVGISLDKTHSARVSDWEMERLSPEQVRYAAEDAMAAVLIFQRLASRDSEDGSSYLHWAFTDGRAGGWGGPHPYHLCPDLIDVKFTEARKMNTKRERKQTAPTSQQRGGVYPDLQPGEARAKAAEIVLLDRDSSRLARQLGRLKDPSKMGARKSQLYHNCMLLDPHGTQLCNIKRDRVDWYLCRGLAVVLHKNTCSHAEGCAAAGGLHAAADHRGECSCLEDDNDIVIQLPY